MLSKKEKLFYIGILMGSTTKKTTTQKTTKNQKFLNDRATIVKAISKGKSKESTLIKKGCITDNLLDNKYKVKDRIGTDSISGEVNKGCYPLTCKYPIAIKKIPMTYEIKYIDKPEDPKVLDKYEVFSELFFLKLSSLLVNNDITPNLPLLYDKYSCEDDCKFTNPELKGKKKCLLVVNELADGDLKYILTKLQPNLETLKIIYFQIYVALYCMRKYFNLYHNDLHYGNVLYRKIKPGGYIKYIIDGQSIIVPNIGYIMILWDFGRSFIPGKIQPYRELSKKNDEELMDYIRVTQMLGGNKGKYENIYNVFGYTLFNLLNKSKTYKDFTMIYSYLVNTDGVKDNEIIAVYNTDKKLTSKEPNINKYIVKNPSKKTNKIIDYLNDLFFQKNKSIKKSTFSSRTLVNSKTKTKT